MSSKTKEVSHKGRIVSITPELTSVEIVSESACASCHAKGLCSLGDSKIKLIELPTRAWENRKVGDEVELVLKASMGHKAVWLAYVAPLLIMVAVLLVLTESGADELVAGLAAILSIGVYYIVLWLFRNRLKNEYIFNIK